MRTPRSIPWQRLSPAAAQLLQSASSLLMTLVLAHAMTPRDFGTAALVITIGTLLLSLNRAMFGEQIIVAVVHRSDTSGYVAFASLQLAAGVVLAAGGGVAASWRLGSVIMLSSLMTTSDLLRYRDLAYGGRRANLTLLLDACRLIASLVAFVLAATGVLTYPSLVSILLGAQALWLLPHPDVLRPRPRSGMSYLRARGSYERAVLIQFCLGTVTILLTPLLAVGLFGASVFGSIKLAQTLSNPVAVLAVAAHPPAIRYFAANAGIDLPRLFRRTVPAFAAVGTITCVLAGAVTLYFQDLIVTAQQSANLAPFYVPALASSLIAFAAVPASAATRARRLGGALVLGQSAGVLLTVVAVGAVAVLRLGPSPFAWAMTAGSAATALSTYLLVLRGSHSAIMG